VRRKLPGGRPKEAASACTDSSPDPLASPPPPARPPVAYRSPLPLGPLSPACRAASDHIGGTVDRPVGQETGHVDQAVATGDQPVST